MKKPCTILFLIDSLSEGGAELALLVLVKTLCSKGFKISVFSFTESRNLAEDFSNSGASLYMPDIGVKESRIDAFKRLKKILKNNYFDVLHANSRNTSIFLGFGLILPSHGCRVVTFQDVHVRAKPFVSSWNFLKEYLILKILENSCDGFTTDSKNNLKDFNKYSSKMGVMYLPNCVVSAISEKNIDVIAVRNRMGVEPDDFVIIIPARYSIQKGHLTFFTAIYHMSSKGLKLPKVICYGAGNELEKLTRYISQNKLNNNIKLNGMVPIEELQLFMLASNLVVLPSLWESFGQVVVGAMALGKPVLGSDTGGISEQIIHNKTGYLVTVGDSKAWSIEVERLMNSPSSLVSVGESAREAVSRIATPEQIGSSLIDYYTQLINQ